MPLGFRTDPPIVTSLISCDNFLQGLIDGKPTLVGVYDDLQVPQFPLTLAIMAVAMLVGVLEPIDIQIYLARLHDDMTETVTTFGGVTQIQPPPTPLLVVSILTHSLFVFPTPGRYDLRLFGNGTFLASKPIMVRQMELPPGGMPPPPGGPQ